MSKKTYWVIGLLIVFITTALIILLVLINKSSDNEPLEPVTDNYENVTIVQPAEDQFGLKDDIPAEELIDEVEDNVDDEPIILPPVMIHQQNSLGLSRIEFNPMIGDISRIFFDKTNNVLLMAVTELDGLNSIWRMINEEKIERVLSENTSPGEIFLGADSGGVVYAGFANPGTLYRSNDNGATWRQVANNIDGAFWNIADDGEGVLWGALHAYNRAIIYRSTDRGFSWSEWKDFHKVYPEYAKTYRAGDPRYELRHLHDIAYHDDKLFVGVGDVARFTAMSEDGGETWRKIWSEGFTAHVPLIDNSGILLGPDKLQSHGVALYNFQTDVTTEVWNPIPHGYAGYAYSMLELGGNYYAAFHTETNEVDSFAGKSGIIVSPDGYKWYPFMELDKVSNWARTDIYLAERNLWSGYTTLNGALYIFEGPIGRWFDVHKSF